MYYLLRPQAPMLWTDADRVTVGFFSERGRDLAALPWRDDTDKVLTNDKVRVALRYGTACSTGLVIEANYILQLTSADELRATHAQVAESRAALADSEDLMERLYPGWKDHGRELDRRIDESSRAEADRRDREAVELLNAPVDETLLQHWISIGGRLPDPA